MVDHFHLNGASGPVSEEALHSLCLALSGITVYHWPAFLAWTRHDLAVPMSSLYTLTLGVKQSMHRGMSHHWNGDSSESRCARQTLAATLASSSKVLRNLISVRLGHKNRPREGNLSRGEVVTTPHVLHVALEILDPAFEEEKGRGPKTFPSPNGRSWHERHCALPGPSSVASILPDGH